MYERLLSVLLLTAAATGCKSRLADGPAPAPASSGAARETPLEAARRLALAPSGGGGFTDRRLADLAKIARASPRKLDAFILLGRAWIAKARESGDPGYYVNAGACVDVALDLAPGSRLALDLRGLVFLNDHRFAESRALAESLVQSDPDDPMAWGTLSDALFELGAVGEAERAAQRMMDIKPSLPSYSRVSYFHWLHGDMASAIELARLAIDAGGDPKSPEPRAWVLVQAAMLFWHRGDYEGADAGFEKALLVLRDFPPALVGRARVALAGGDPARAVELLARAHERSPLVETAWLLGDALELAGHKERAAEIFTRAAREGQRADRRTLSLMYSARGERAADALRLAEEEKATRGDPYTDDALAWALYRNGKIDAAKAAIDRATALGTKDARLLFHRGAIYLAAGEQREGKRLLAEALALNPKFDVAGEAEARRLLSAS